jgi:hypothetical protein
LGLCQKPSAKAILSKNVTMVGVGIKDVTGHFWDVLNVDAIHSTLPVLLHRNVSAARLPLLHHAVFGFPRILAYMVSRESQMQLMSGR